MANEEEEEKLDLTSRLVDTYQKANAALLERVSIMKESYKQAAREDELVKQVLANANASKVKAVKETLDALDPNKVKIGRMLKKNLALNNLLNFF